MVKRDEKTFWISNISNRNVSLSDLNLTIRAFSSVNLLDKKHYHLTEEQIEQSHLKGSLFAKKAILVKRLVAPGVQKDVMIEREINPSIPSRQRSTVEIKIEEYEELKLSSNKEEALRQEFDAIAENIDSDDDQTISSNKKG